MSAAHIVPCLQLGVHYCPCCLWHAVANCVRAVDSTYVTPLMVQLSQQQQQQQQTQVRMHSPGGECLKQAAQKQVPASRGRHCVLTVTGLWEWHCIGLAGFNFCNSGLWGAIMLHLLRNAELWGVGDGKQVVYSFRHAQFYRQGFDQARTVN
jgi:hypothetical protein